MNSPDVCVLGGGPAGCACALGLARAGLDVLVLERSAYDETRIGEMLPSQAASALRLLGVWEAFLADGHLPSSGVVSLWNGIKPVERDAIFSPEGAGWHLDRAKFDAMLARAVESRGVPVLRNSRVLELQRDEKSWDIRVHSPIGERRLKPSFIVDATGRASWLARRQGAKRIVYDSLVGIVGAIDFAAQPDHRFHLEAFESGWWYATALPDAKGIAFCMIDADALPRVPAEVSRFWLARLGDAPLIGGLVGPAPSPAFLKTVAAGTSRLDFPSGLGWIAVGDACASYDPLSSRGITMALATGVAGAAAIVDAIRKGLTEPSPDFAINLHADFSAYLKTWRHYYAPLAARWPDSPFWKNRVS